MAKQKWTSIETTLARLVVQRQTVQKMEEELERNLAERHRLLEDISQLEKRFLSEKNVDERQAVFEQLEAYQAKVKYVNEQLSEVQTAIMEVDGSNKVRLWHILSTRDKEGLIEVVEERKKKILESNG